MLKQTFPWHKKSPYCVQHLYHSFLLLQSPIESFQLLFISKRIRRHISWKLFIKQNEFSHVLFLHFCIRRYAPYTRFSIEISCWIAGKTIADVALIEKESITNTLSHVHILQHRRKSKVHLCLVQYNPFKLEEHFKKKKRENCSLFIFSSLNGIVCKFKTLFFLPSAALSRSFYCSRVCNNVTRL